MPQTRLKIMLVEDDTIIGRYLSEVLEEGGYDVIQCLSNGRDALRAAVPLKPDLVLMDISLPGDIDGVEVAKQFKNSTTSPWFSSPLIPTGRRSRGRAMPTVMVMC